MTRRHLAGSLLLLASLAGVAGAAAVDGGGWRAERVAGEVLIQDQETLRALVDGAPLGRRAALRLPDESTQLTLSRQGARLRTRGPSQLALRDDLPPADIPKVQLLTGAARIDAPPEADLRINVGQLRVRLTGAEAWLGADADADRVCALRGRIAVQVPGSTQTLSLAQPGSCLALDADGNVSEEQPSREALNARLARADGGMAPLPVSFQPARESEQAERQPVDSLRQSAAAMRSGTPVHRPAAGKDTAQPIENVPEEVWYVVLGAFSHRHLAERAVEAMPGMGAKLLAAPNAGVVRVALGPYGDRRIAAKVREGQLARYPGAWLLEQVSRPSKD